MPRRDFILVTPAVIACRKIDVEKTNSSSLSIAAISHGGILNSKCRHAR
jgi:hypothetical protein